MIHFEFTHRHIGVRMYENPMLANRRWSKNISFPPKQKRWKQTVGTFIIEKEWSFWIQKRMVLKTTEWSKQRLHQPFWVLGTDTVHETTKCRHKTALPGSQRLCVWIVWIILACVSSARWALHDPFSFQRKRKADRFSFLFTSNVCSRRNPKKKS
jgi:hypothetical protein